MICAPQPNRRMAGGRCCMHVFFLRMKGDSQEGGGGRQSGGDANFRDKCAPTPIWSNPFFFPLMMNGAGNHSRSRPNS